MGTDTDTGTNNTTINLLGTLTINNVDIGNEQIVLNGGTLNGEGTATASGTVMLMTAADTVSTISVSDMATLTLSGQISGTSGLMKDGDGTLTLSGADVNDYSGVTTVNDGTLIVGKASGLGAIGATANTRINADGTLTINAVNIGTEEIILNGGILRGMGTGANAGGTITLMADSNISALNAVADRLTLSGVISGTGGFIKMDAGMLTLSGTNTYSGVTTVNDGTIMLANNSGLGNATGNTIVNNPSSLIAISPSTTIAENFVMNGGAIGIQTGNVALSGNIDLMADSLVGVADTGAMLTLSGQISSISGAFGLTKDGLGTLILSGTNMNDYSGVTTVNDGTLIVEKDSGLGAIGATANTSIDGGTLTINGVNIGTEAIVLNGGTLGGMGTTATAGGTITLMADGTISVSDGGMLTLNGEISGTSALRKEGEGTLILSGADANDLQRCYHRQ